MMAFGFAVDDVSVASSGLAMQISLLVRLHDFGGWGLLAAFENLPP